MFNKKILFKSHLKYSSDETPILEDDSRETSSVIPRFEYNSIETSSDIPRLRDDSRGTSSLIFGFG